MAGMSTERTPLIDFDNQSLPPTSSFTTSSEFSRGKWEKFTAKRNADIWPKSRASPDPKRQRQQARKSDTVDFIIVSPQKGRASYQGVTFAKDDEIQLSSVSMLENTENGFPQSPYATSPTTWDSRENSSIFQRAPVALMMRLDSTIGRDDISIKKECTESPGGLSDEPSVDPTTEQPSSIRPNDPTTEDLRYESRLSIPGLKIYFSSPSEDGNQIGSPPFSPKPQTSTHSSPESSSGAHDSSSSNNAIATPGMPGDDIPRVSSALITEENAISLPSWDGTYENRDQDREISEGRDSMGLEDIVHALQSNNVHPDNWASNHGLKLQEEECFSNGGSDPGLPFNPSNVENEFQYFQTTSPVMSSDSTTTPIQAPLRKSTVLNQPNQDQLRNVTSADGSGLFPGPSKPSQQNNTDPKVKKKRAFARRGPRKHDQPLKRRRPPNLSIEKQHPQQSALRKSDNTPESTPNDKPTEAPQTEQWVIETIPAISAPQVENVFEPPPRPPQIPSVHQLPTVVFNLSSPAQQSLHQLPSPPPMVTSQDHSPFHSNRLSQQSPVNAPSQAILNSLQNYRPPAVIFTIDNRAESLLVSVEVQSLIERFSKIANVLIRPPGAANPTKSFPIGVIMWQPLVEFYKWVSKAFCITTTPAMRFELIDVHWQPEKVFIVPEGHLEYFRLLKQYIWDLFWVASTVMPGDNSFRISIMPVMPTKGMQLVGKELPLRWEPNNALPAPGPVPQMMNQAGVTPRGQSFLPSQSEVHPIPIQVPPIMNGNSGSLLVPKRPIGMASSNYVAIPLSQTTNMSPKQQHHLQDHPIPTRDSSQRNSEQVTATSAPAGLFKRSARDDMAKQCLRNEAQMLISDRADLELEIEESTSSRGIISYREYPQVYGGLVDMNSGDGIVGMSEPGKEERRIVTIYKPTFQRNEYTHFTLGPRQSVKVFGETVVLFYRQRKSAPAAPALALPQIQPRSTSTTANNPTHIQPHIPPPKHETLSDRTSSSSAPLQAIPPTSSTPPTPEILIRLQTSPLGHFSTPYPKSVIRPKLTTEEFFAWFATQTSHCLPISLERLRFTFKDAMPVPHSSEIARGNEEHFMFMRRDIKVQCERAGKFMPRLKEFGILVTVPGWSTGMGEEDGDGEGEW